MRNSSQKSASKMHSNPNICYYVLGSQKILSLALASSERSSEAAAELLEQLTKLLSKATTVELNGGCRDTQMRVVVLPS